MLLQDKIDAIKKGDLSVKITEEELYHPMYWTVALLNINQIEYFEGNSKTIRSKIDSITDDFHSELFRPIIVCAIDGAKVSKEGDHYVVEGGRIIALDGHHRITVIDICGLTRVMAFVRTDLKTYEEVVNFYVRLNTSYEKEKKTKKNIYDLAKKIPGTTDFIINKVTSRYGKEVDAFSEKNVYGCIGTLRSITEKFGEYVLDRTIYVLTKAFRGDENSLKFIVVKTIAAHLHKHQGDLDVPGWLDQYITYLQTRPACEWKERWSPKSEFVRIDTKKIEESIRVNRKYSPKFIRRNGISHL